MRNAFEYKNSELFCEGVPLQQIADRVGTPCFVYSSKALRDAFNELDSAFSGIDNLISYSVKSNGNLAVLSLLGNLGAGADIVSQGELFRALKAGIAPEKIVYSGVGKSDEEIRYALESGIMAFNVESLPELEHINRVAADTGITASISLRVNPDVESHTHAYTTTGKKETKFGVPFDEAMDTYLRAADYEYIRVAGIDTHIGSQIVRTEPFVRAFEKIAGLYRALEDEGFEMDFFDIGGGLGIRYREETPPTAAEFAEAVLPLVQPLGCRLVIEPGRFISGNAGVMLSRAIYYKQTEVKNFVIVDAGMNDLIRPSLYDAYHEVEPVRRTKREMMEMDVVGPICESGDWLAKDRLLPKFEEGDLLCVFSAGAYGFAMSSNYNSRPRGAEVMVDGSEFSVVREAETLEDLIRGEKVPEAR